MKIIAHLLTVFLCSNYAFGQLDSMPKPARSVALGVDIFKSLPSFIINEKYFTQKTVVVEPSVQIQGKSSRKSLMFSFGFVSGSTNKNTLNFINRQHFQGLYFKTGFETRHKLIPLSIGVGPVISMNFLKGTYEFKGPTFGDYQGEFADQSIALGIHGYLAYDFTTGKKSFMRVSGQASTVLFNGKIDPYYYPGLGLSAKVERGLVSVGGITAQFFYQLR